MNKRQQQIARSPFTHHCSDICWTGLKSNMTFSAKRNQVVSGVGFIYGIRYDMVDIQALPLRPKIGLRDPAPLASIAIAFSDTFRNFLPVVPALIMLRRPALPRWMTAPSHIFSLPRGVALFGTELGIIGAVRRAVSAALSANKFYERLTGAPAGIRAKLSIACRYGLKVYVAGNAGPEHSISGRSNVFATGISADFRAESLPLNWVKGRATNFARTIYGLDLAATSSSRQPATSARTKRTFWMFGVVKYAAILAGFFHGIRLAPSDNKHKADIARRMEYALTGPDTRSRAIAKAKSAGKAEDHGPLFAEDTA